MRGQKLILVKGVYSLEKWTKPNPLMSTENRPVDISSVAMSEVPNFPFPPRPGLECLSPGRDSGLLGLKLMSYRAL